MIKLTAKQIKKVKGIIVWDFDRVLFDTDTLIRDREKVMQRHGVPPQKIRTAYKFLMNLIDKTAKRPFSTTFFIETLKREKVLLKQNTLREDFRKLLIKYQYLDPAADRLLHDLRKRGFLHIMVSWGSAPYQYRKIHTACSASFLRHFARVIVTTRPKYIILKKITHRFPTIQTFFIDDSKEHIGLVKAHLPNVVALHFTSGKSLQGARQEILRRVRRDKRLNV